MTSSMSGQDEPNPVLALRTVLVVKAVPKYVTLNKALDFKITTLL